jgi:hypothetical protein
MMGDSGERLFSLNHKNQIHSNHLKEDLTLLVKARVLSKLGFRPQDNRSSSKVFWDIGDDDEPCLRQLSFGDELAVLEFSKTSGGLFLFVEYSRSTDSIWIDARSGLKTY